jgi:hypothetical protein
MDSEGNLIINGVRVDKVSLEDMIWHQ